MSNSLWLVVQEDSEDLRSLSPHSGLIDLNSPRCWKDLGWSFACSQFARFERAILRNFVKMSSSSWSNQPSQARSIQEYPRISNCHARRRLRLGSSAHFSAASWHLWWPLGGWGCVFLIIFCISYWLGNCLLQSVPPSYICVRPKVIHLLLVPSAVLSEFCQQPVQAWTVALWYLASILLYT